MYLTVVHICKIGHLYNLLLTSQYCSLLTNFLATALPNISPGQHAGDQHDDRHATLGSRNPTNNATRQSHIQHASHYLPSQPTTLCTLRRYAGSFLFYLLIVLFINPCLLGGLAGDGPGRCKILQPRKTQYASQRSGSKCEQPKSLRFDLKCGFELDAPDGESWNPQRIDERHRLE